MWAGRGALAAALAWGALPAHAGAPVNAQRLGNPENWGSARYSDSQPLLSWRDLSEQGRMGAVCDPGGNPENDCGRGLVCRAGICRHCLADHECPSLHRCKMPLAGASRCVREARKAWELACTDPWEAFCTMLILMAATLSAAAGTGGGGIFVPVLISFSTLKAESAVPLSQCMCLCGALVNVSVFLARRHPESYDRPVIDYDCIMLFAPMLFLGVTLGVLLNQMSPQWLLLFLLMLTLGSALWRTGGKGLKQYRQENAMLQHISMMSRQSTPSRSPRGEKAASVVVESLRDYFEQVAELTDSYAWQVVGVFTVWILMLTYSTMSAQVCTTSWALSLFVLSVMLVACTVVAFRYITKSWSKRISTPTPAAVAPSYGSTELPGQDFKLGESLIEASLGERLKFPGVAFGAGVLGGLLGLGGGIILGPVLLEVGMHSEAVHASTASFVLLSSSLATVQFARAGLVVDHYAVWYGFVTVVATWAGQSLCESYARKRKRYSFITLAIAGVLGASLVSLLFVGARNVFQDIYMGRDMGFTTSRLCAGQGLRILATDAAPATSWPADLPPYSVGL